MRILTYVSLFIAVISASWMLSLDRHHYNTILTEDAKNEKQEEAFQSDSFSSFLMADTIPYIAPSGDRDSVAFTLSNCTDIYRFRSDEIPAGTLYRDKENILRNNVITICPPNNGERRLLVTFTRFNLAAGDTLLVYDGQDTLNSPLVENSMGEVVKASGSSVSAINGGWLNSNCDPSINPSSCLTFQFKTNGDGMAGSGWEGFINCIDEPTATFSKAKNILARADCGTLVADVDIKMPTVIFGNDTGFCSLAKDSLANDSIIVEYFFNEVGTASCHFTDTLRADSILSIKSLPYGVYDVKFKLLKDTTIKTGCILAITTPAFICNDEVTAAIGQGCQSFLRPDDLLENFGDTCSTFNHDTIKQFFVIHVDTDTGRVSGTIANPPLLSGKEGGNVVCGGQYNVFITRVIELKDLQCGTRGSDPIQYRDSCQVKVNFVDGIKPVFVDIRQGLIVDTLNKIDTFIGCQDIQISPDHLTKPKVFDNCELDYSLEVQVPEIELEACDTNKFIFVKWSVSDKCGNTSEAIQEILIQRPTAKNLHAPKDTMLACGIYPSPDITGWPRLDTNDDGITDLDLITDGGATCFLDVHYRDDTIPVCGNAIRIIRYWDLRNFCANEQSVTPADTQVIEIIDTLPPIMFKPAPGVIGSYENPYIFPSSPTTCEGIPGMITAPGGVDSCDYDFQTQIIELHHPNGQIEPFPELDRPLLIGQYSAGFIHIDACGNRSDTCFIYFAIKDSQAPTPICTDELRVSMTSGNFPIRPEDVNNGSTDNCGIEHLFIRRSICNDPSVMDPTINEYILTEYDGQIAANGWGDYIEVGCCDINEVVRVQLLAIDGGGNYNQCWLNIYPEDHLEPICAALPDTIVYCDEFHAEDLGIRILSDHGHIGPPSTLEWTPIPEDELDVFNATFGHPSCVDNVSCNSIYMEQEYQLINELCGVQKVRRRYRALDLVGDGNASKWIEQNILVAYRPGWVVTFPSDTTFQCGSAIPEFPITLTDGSCDLLKWEYKDEIFAGSGGGCYKILRRWEIINSCVLENNPDIIALPRDPGPSGEVGYYNHRTFSARDLVDGHYLGDYGHFTYTQILKVVDREVPILHMSVENECIIGEQNCRAIKNFTITTEDCTFSQDIILKYELYEGTSLVHAGEGPIVEYPVTAYDIYRLKVEAYDNCGNSTVQEQLFGFKDCDPPIALCNGGNLNIDINADQKAEIPAVWLNNRSFDNCDGDLEYKIWHYTVSNTPPTNPEAVSLLPSSITLGCGDMGQSAVVLYVVDDVQNYASCMTNITIQDVSRYCPLSQGTRIAGNIATIDGEMVEGVEVFLREGPGDVLEGTNSGSATAMQMTGTDGNFSFTATTGQDLTVIPKKNINVRNGVSTFDIVLMQKHILGITSLDSPYKYIAADVNKSGTITAYDIVQLRQLILEIIPAFPNNESWRFINADYPMDTANPLSNFEETHQVSNIQDVVDVDFIAVKVGDVSSNATPNALMPVTPRSNTQTLPIVIKDQALKAGQQYEVKLSIQDQDYQGFQLALAHPQLSLVDWQSNKLQTNHISSSTTRRDIITISWNQPTLNKGEQITTELTLTFEALADGQLSDLLSLSPKPLFAEAYTNADEIIDVELIFETTVEQRTFEAYQNKPNPFTNTTTIEFYTPTSSPVSLKIMDVTGTVLYQQTDDYAVGTHQILLNREQLSRTGLFYYELASASGRITKTMLLVQ